MIERGGCFCDFKSAADFDWPRLRCGFFMPSAISNGAIDKVLFIKFCRHLAVP